MRPDPPKKLVWFLCHRRAAGRSSLVAALVSCVESPRTTRTRRFLPGLSSDELQLIAEFLGCRILESSADAGRSRTQLAWRIAQHEDARAQRCCWDGEHR